MKFYLGTHQPNWLAQLDVPLFVSRVRLVGRRSFPRARAPWALDSGAFSEIQLHGRWTVEPERYVDEVRAIAAGIGLMEWASIQDWMCEPHMLERTGLTIEDHQARTVANYLRLRELAPEIVWTPVLQGWQESDYHAHVAAYERAGVDLFALPWVGVGSVCRRQDEQEGAQIITGLAARLGPRLHAFGFKQAGLTALKRFAIPLRSADSMAWSFRARRTPRPLQGCTHKNCNNCPRFALRWRKQLLEALHDCTDYPLFDRAERDLLELAG